MSSDHRAELEEMYKGFVSSFPKVSITNGLRTDTVLKDSVFLLIIPVPQIHLQAVLHFEFGHMNPD